MNLLAPDDQAVILAKMAVKLERPEPPTCDCGEEHQHFVRAVE